MIDIANQTALSSKHSHPLDGFMLSVAGFKAFRDHFEPLPIAPINLIIGRNNTGKSALVDLLEVLGMPEKWLLDRHRRRDSQFELFVQQKLEEDDVKKTFRPDTHAGGIPGHDHFQYGKRLIGDIISRTYFSDKTISNCKFPSMPGVSSDVVNTYGRLLVERARNPFGNLTVKISAERKVQPEPVNNDRSIQSDGQGVTNLIRAFITSSDLPREIVQKQVLNDLNSIYEGDSQFDEITCREDVSLGLWEIFLTEHTKGDIRLSQSGSSLQSIFIVLAVVRLIPIIESKRKWEKMVLIIEEPENNLHPSLLRRLLSFLANFRQEAGFTLFLTSHSPVGIDWAACRDDSQVLHVKQNFGASSVQIASGHGPAKLILEDLDFRASDILQANCVLWVEGPTDRTYLNKWIDLVSDGRLIEGSHYTCMFYGGRLLSHLDALPPDDRDNELISLLALNRNAAVILDSDRHPGGNTTKSGRVRKPRMALNDTKKRIISEVESSGGMAWVTEGREIENYTPMHVLERIAEAKGPTENAYVQIPELPFLKGFKGDKVQLARAVVETLTISDIRDHLDLWVRLEELQTHILRWNGLSVLPPPLR